jgi:hypothetical protein
MKPLQRNVGRVERRRAGSRGVRAKAFGVVWSDPEQLLDRLPGPGEYVACDLTVLGDPVALRQPGALGAALGPPRVRSVERFPADPADLGRVLLENGSEVGVVSLREGSLLSFRWHGPAFLEDSSTAGDTQEPAPPAASA